MRVLQATSYRLDDYVEVEEARLPFKGLPFTAKLPVLVGANYCHLRHLWLLLNGPLLGNETRETRRGRCHNGRRWEELVHRVDVVLQQELVGTDLTFLLSCRLSRIDGCLLSITLADLVIPLRLGEHGPQLSQWHLKGQRRVRMPTSHL